MKVGSTILATLMLVGLAAPAVQAAATVAVMPVQGVNLTEGQCDAIGVLFATAFARETNVAVATPLETKPVMLQARTSLATAAKLGVFEYIELSAVQLGSKTNLGAIRFSKDGHEIFRSETAANGMDDMGNAVARLARSLAWAQPIAPPLNVARELPPPQPLTVGPRPYPPALGLKSGMLFTLASGKDFTTMMSLQFSGRIGPRGSFAEVGAGFAVPGTSAADSGTIKMGGLYAELGGGAYLSDGSVAPYLGGGVSPRIWFLDAANSESTGGATCAVYGMAGVTFTRDSRARLFSEVRVAQYVIGLATPHASGASSSTFYPTELSLQVGIGW
jgi:hypothetical protein